ncbi:head maturation protease, ClpP-related [Pseudonocardia sp. WMMC193]|uniref:head maturation protease, ClpP-related n=1 Tax=Pseudonocardia sp. WMMC193 TaxID=2911965 RepID=UPI001F43EEF9|nr:head maturation protease, ClpP-related [Pseudonocardia sp. WMMC193]MCF7548515.1 Clp protease ClpP [Pseudonocardia sp. WMMC193]
MGTKQGRCGVYAAAGTSELWLMDEVGAYGVTAKQFLADLKLAGSGPLDVHVSSPGGDVWDGLAMFEALRSHVGKVTVYVDSLAASIASVIAMAADEVVMAPGAMMMIHEAATATWGDERDHLASAALLGQISTLLSEIYAARAGGRPSQWRATMREETWYSASEAVAAGLADRVAEPPTLRAPLARLERSVGAAAARPHRNMSASMREAFRANGSAVRGVVLARAGGAARRPANRRATPSADWLLKVAAAVQRAAR